MILDEALGVLSMISDVVSEEDAMTSYYFNANEIMLKSAGGRKSRSLGERFSDIINVEDWFDEGEADACAAFDRAFAAAISRGCWAVYAPGVYNLDAQNATALDLTTYAYDDVALKACIIKPYGIRLLTSGYRTEFRITNIDATTCGIAISEDDYSTPASHSNSGDYMDPFVLRAMDGNGRYGVVTPNKSLLFLNKRPIYNMNVHFCGPNVSQTITSYGWAKGLKIGPNRGGDYFFGGYGTYNAASADAGQHQMVGMDVEADGAYGMNIRFIAHNMRTFFHGGDGLEGFSLTNYEGQGCWEGVVLDPTDGEPGGFIDAGHINTNRVGYKFVNRPRLHVGRVEAYRSGGYHDHGSDWDGMIIQDCPVAGVDVDYLAVSHATTLDRTNSRAGTITNSPGVLKGYSSEYVNTGFVVDGAPHFEIGAGKINNVSTLFDLRGAALRTTIGNVHGQGGVISAFAIFDANVDKKYVNLPQDSALQTRKYQTITVSAAATNTVVKRLTVSDLELNMQAGTGAFTYDVILSRAGCVPGDKAHVRIIGNSSPNPTIRICDDSTSSIKSTFNNIGGSVRLQCEYVFTESGTWAEVGIYASVESSY
jgi:hypothetical protein